ncbi:LacI family DNA-binding transcriptional regulator [Periweissella cryptocerci]|uniref:LacI family DNA-binding transcriptional regulator n=1 Tax=Periweissella cryptocerci TaxID=2506420 RepID=A0A4P6YUH0_9LACO|nr:LacI family DNA-binding transcriptional regulator [Periweissella cryptocerci]QBO36337.1 LacI family DNA-binding transcriptional regulator [Periweissella cryptocerci]
MVTIRDIAQQAGVSVSTASRALNDNPKISQATRTRIQEIAAKVGYQANFNAKTLTLGEANVVGVVFPVAEERSLENPFFIDVMAGINAELSEHRYVLSVAIGATTEKVLANVRAMVLQAKVKRFILLYTKEDDPVSAFLREQDVRYVVIGQPLNQETKLYVDNDNYDAGYATTELLLKEHQSIQPLFVKSEADWHYETERERGFKDATQMHDIQALVIKAETSKSDIILQYVSQHPEIDGIIATDDSLAFAMLTQWRQFYHHDISVIGFNNNQLLNQLAGEKFHTVDLHANELGLEAAKLLFAEVKTGHTNVEFTII